MLLSNHQHIYLLHKPPEAEPEKHQDKSQYFTLLEREKL